MAGSGKDLQSADLAEIRKRINDVDERIQALINERATIAQQVGVAKGDLGSAVDYYRPEREAEVLRGVLERNEGPIRDEEMLRLFREIMSACLAQQEPLKIGFLGPEGTFTQTAVFKHFGHSVRALPFHTIDEVFQEVECSAADFGVVPIENSTLWDPVAHTFSNVLQPRSLAPRKAPRTKGDKQWQCTTAYCRPCKRK